MKRERLIFSAFVLIAAIGAVCISTLSICGQSAKNPVILIPGVTGSELVNDATGEIVWLKAQRSKFDDIRLPITADPLKARDGLRSGDILRSVKIGIFPRIDVYAGLIDALKVRGGYHEESWDDPTVKGGENAIYVFAYDWRLDNVETARQLVRKIEQLKRKLKKPGLRFDVIAHSMGGLIARYASMYGDVDLPPSGRIPRPTWAGAKNFDRVVLLGTPSEGSALALNALINGFSLGPITFNLPFVQNISKFDVFTTPTAYELLPAPGTFHAVDENFEPLDIDIYDPKQWDKYGWNAINDLKFAEQFRIAEQRSAKSFFESMLVRAKRLHEALAVPLDRVRGPVFELVGGDCRDTLDTVIVYRDTRRNVWRTMFKAETYFRAGGEKVTAEEARSVMFLPGDGVVTRRSFTAETQSGGADANSILKPNTVKFICSDHNRQGTSIEIQDHLISILESK